jgi:type IV pilus assembly protein PilE
MRKTLCDSAGFTLVELIISVIIIAILITIAIPLYMDTIERGKGAKATKTLDLIRTAQTIYRTEALTFTANLALLQAVTPFPANDGDWAYSVSAADNTTFTAQAVRNSGEFAGQSITLDEDNDFTYGGGDSWPP